MCGAGDTPREAIYAGFLPNVDVNRRYVAEQLTAYRQRTLPPDFSAGRSIPRCVQAGVYCLHTVVHSARHP